jgi:hypothetical protein
MKIFRHGSICLLFERKRKENSSLEVRKPYCNAAVTKSSQPQRAVLINSHQYVVVNMRNNIILKWPMEPTAQGHWLGYAATGSEGTRECPFGILLHTLIS